MTIHLPLPHAGQTRTLVKHPRVAAALAAGQLTPDQARAHPWYLRAKLAGKTRRFKLHPQDKLALAAARDLLNGHTQQPLEFTEFLQQKEARRGITLGALAAEWFTAGLPFDGESARTTAAAEQLRGATQRALTFWTARRVLGIVHHTMTEFVNWRRQHIRPGSEGSRSADLELAALSSLCQWAVLTERIATNPFAQRKRFQKRDAVSHCHQAMPEHDEQLHAILRWLWRDPAHEQRIVAGGALAFGALSGLRPGEPMLLQNLPAATTLPNLRTAAPGLIYPVPDGSRRMRVFRLKRGQNPAITIHPALADFLSVWKARLTRLTPDPEHLALFPVAQSAVADQLSRACTALGLPAMKPHGFTRAYYVRVRRSQGADDATIAVELGQSSNGDLIRSVYGDPGDGVGGHLHDWLPVDGPPAWTLLTA